MTNSDDRLGSLVRKRRDELGLSLRQLGERIGITDTTIMRIESGAIRSPRGDVLRALAEGLDLPLADLFAAAGYATPNELPSFQPYLRTKYHELPDRALRELERSFSDITGRYAKQGPASGEDET